MTNKTVNNEVGKHSLSALALGTGLLALSVGAHAEWIPVVATDDASGVRSEILYAGQTIDAGDLNIEVVDEQLVITYNTSGGWEASETHLWVGTDLADMPQTRQGNPKIGGFPYSGADSYSIPLTQLGFSCPSADAEYYVAAHAAVQLSDGSGNVIQSETAWADGDRFVQKGMWGTFTTITLSCATVDEPPAPPVAGACETAFAYAGGTNTIDGDTTNSFLEIDEDGDGRGDFNRWGWSNGAIGAGQYSWDVYAGAGQSDITKGTLVGSLTVDYDGTNAHVTYHIDAPYYMEENHLYVGSDILPRDVNGQYTVAPGQYPTIHDTLPAGAQRDDYFVSGLSGNVHVVAHATVCGF